MSDNGSVKSEHVLDVVGEEKPKERKSIEETVTALRKELQVLYESLADKNEQLLCLEKDVRDRDISIKYLKNEYKKLKDSVAPTCPTCHKKVLKANDQNGKVEESKAQPDEILCKMQKDLKDREGLIKELNKKILRLSDNLIFVQKESLAKDDRIDDMQREIDKFRQVVNFWGRIASATKLNCQNYAFKGPTVHQGSRRAAQERRQPLRPARSGSRKHARHS